MDIRVILSPDTSVADACFGLESYGFKDPKAAFDNLKLIASGMDASLHAGVLSNILAACSLSADPDACLNGFERVSEASVSRESFLGLMAARPDSVKIIAPLLASCRFLTTFIVGDPEANLGWLFTDGRLDAPLDKDAMLKGCLKACPPDTPVSEAMVLIRHFKYREFLRITVRDILGRAGLVETTLELSNLADAAIETAYRVVSRTLDKRFGPPRYKSHSGKPARCPFAVIAMGKLGGRELNFSSDVDIMYVYLTGEGETKGPHGITNHQYFVKLSEGITRLIGENTADGFVFRVDLRLRPEGERGEIVQNLRGYELYYESWGQTWERSALLKARPCAGDPGLGRDFMDTVRPFVFRKYLDYSSIGEIRDMKERVEKAGALKAGKEIDLKLGVGGIREVEFFISSLQLIYGGRDAGIRERNSMKALHKLALKDLISFEEQKDLSRAYVFLRTAEHRLQLVEERQTHSLPMVTPEIEALARRMGFRDGQGVSAGDAFLGHYERHTGRVREIYNGLFKERGQDGEEARDAFDVLLSEEAAFDDAAGVLKEAGFSDTEKAYRNVVLLRDGSPGSALTPRSRRLFMEIIPSLLHGCAGSPDPDMALNNLEFFVSAFGSREAMYTLIKDRPEAAGLITRLLGSSEYFARLLIAHPDMTDLLLISGAEGFDKEKDALTAELTGLITAEGSFARKMDTLRRYKHGEEIRVGMKDLIVNPGYRAVSRDLTALALVVLDAALDMAMEDVAAKYGLPPGVSKGSGVAVVGLGKLGAGELIYGSDLDIVFIHEEAGQTGKKGGIGASEFFARIAERVIFALSSLTREGAVFRVDTRLRPGGSKGVIAHTLSGLGRYYEKSASLWELQALTRASAVAGDRSLFPGFDLLRADVLSRPKDKDRLASEIKAMRARMERELAKKGGGGDIKHGKGGIVDILFTVQYLQLLHCPEDKRLLSPDIVSVLDALTEDGFIGRADAEVLKESYGFLRDLESKIRITTGQPESVLPVDMHRLTVLAARMGYGPGGEKTAAGLMEEYKGHAARVRRVFEGVL